MIPTAYITEWRSHAPWIQNAWVEQDLIISRALVRMPFRVESSWFSGAASATGAGIVGTIASELSWS